MHQIPQELDNPEKKSLKLLDLQNDRQLNWDIRLPME
jgi:hypothetical protein